MYRRVVVKIGSGVISHEGKLDAQALKHIVDQIALLREQKVEVVLITSGAVATGRGMITIPKGTDPIVEKQLFAAVGQVQLMARYAELFNTHRSACAQVLVTKEDFRDRQHYLNMRRCLEGLLKNTVIPIINENDTIAITELIFTDNDELAGLVASQMNADAVIILTSVEGVLNGSPSNPASQVIPTITLRDIAQTQKFVTNEKSSAGRGGMHTKFAIAKKLMKQGIAVHFAHGKRRNVITDIVASQLIGTTFVPMRKVSGTKRWLAYADGFTRGSVHINACAREAITSGRAASLLPVGVTKVTGAFERGDIIEIRDETNKKIGFGIARYGAKKAQDSMGQKDIPALIHYDYFFIE